MLHPFLAKKKLCPSTKFDAPTKAHHVGVSLKTQWGPGPVVHSDPAAAGSLSKAHAGAAMDRFR